jgi:hypothetical protein
MIVNPAVEGSRTGSLVKAEGWVATGWSRYTYRLGLGWTVEGMGNASFVFRSEDATVWAVFPGGVVEGSLLDANLEIISNL